MDLKKFFACPLISHADLEINHITFEYDALDEVHAKGESYSYYDVHLADCGRLAIRLNLKDAENGCYSFQEV
jgi:hypothetical protein